MSEPTRTLNFTRKRAVTLPVMSFKGRTAAFVRFLGEIERSDVVDPNDDKKEPAMVAHVLDLETDEEATLICPTLLVTSMTERERDYVGRYYEIRVSPTVREGKKYKEVTVYEIEPDSGADHV